MKKHTNGYFDLLDLLNKYPEFSSIEDNPCDVAITSFGKYIWEQWGQSETANMSELDRQIEQEYYRSLYKKNKTGVKRFAEPETEKIRIEFNASKKASGNSALGQKINYNYSHLRYAIEGTETLRQAASMLGIPLPQLRKLIIEFGLDKEVVV